MRTDYLLWLAVSATLFAIAAVGQLTTFPALDYLRRHVADMFRLAIAAAVVGWFVQAILADFGIRLSGGRPPDQSADYDDKPPAPPSAG